MLPLSSSSLLFFSLFLVTSFSDDSASFSGCDLPFSCGSISNITYPFAGAGRPPYCGLPQYNLTCAGDQTLFTHNSITYRVLHINQTLRSLTLARTDLWNQTCPSRLANSTLNSTLFTVTNDDVILSLIYGCDSSNMSVTPHNRFSCNVTGSNLTDSYYLIGPIPSDPILRIINCSVSITLPVLRRVGDDLTGERLSLRQALMEGFSLNYSDPYERHCRGCTRVGGLCGSDPGSGQPICICDNRVCPVDLAPPPGPNPLTPIQGGQKNQTPLSVGLAIAGAVLAGIGIGWLIFYCKQRKKRLAAQAAQTENKGLTTPSPRTESMEHAASTKGSTTPTVAFTKSLPSYTSSNTDFGKETSYFGVQVFSYAELEEATDNFDQSRELGDGGFGTVYYGKLQDGRVVAVKRLYENNFKRMEQFMNEVEILTRLRHQNLVALFGCTSKRSRELVLIYEYIPNGTVADHLHGKRAKSGLLSWPIRLNIAVETAEALAYLHTSDVIHRDVKTNNILLDNDFHVKVGDFGLSRLFPTDVTHVSTAPQGTPGYVDPEYYQCYQLTEKSDVYSFGVVLIELISSLQAVDTNRHRHDINLANMAVNKIQNHTLHELVDPSLGFETNNPVRRMITLVAELAFRCLQQERDMRPSMLEVVEALKRLQTEGSKVQKAEVLDILVDDPPSIDLDVADRSSSNSAPNSIGCDFPPR